MENLELQLITNYKKQASEIIRYNAKKGYQFYVYSYADKDTGVIFYVGKGKGKRCLTLKGKTIFPWVKNIKLKLHKFYILESSALIKEYQLITELGRFKIDDKGILSNLAKDGVKINPKELNEFKSTFLEEYNQIISFYLDN